MTDRKDGPRPAVIGTCTLSPYVVDDSAQLLADGLAMLDDMAQQAETKGWDPDLMVLPETFAQLWESGADNAEPIDGPIVAAVAEKARAYHTYVATPVRTLTDGVIHNSLIMLDRVGQPIGTYHKVFVTTGNDGSLEGGAIPGSEFPLFELDFGRVGAQICYDVFFANGWQSYDDQDAERVIFSSATPPVIASHRAMVTSQYLGSMSMPYATRPVCSAAISTAPAPANGSTTMSRFTEYGTIIRLASSTGNGHGWPSMWVGGTSSQ